MAIAKLFSIATRCARRRSGAPLAEGQDDYAAFITVASPRFDILVVLIHAVMCAESTSDVRAVSDKGALALMQVMPASYPELRARNRLGVDMFDPRDNILAETANMRETRDCFGSPCARSSTPWRSTTR